MAWREISYTYAYTHLFQKHLLWLAANANIYIAMRESEDDSWTYYAGTAAHALDTGLVLTAYSAEADAQTNYLTTDKDANDKVVTMLPAIVQARFVKLFVESGSGVQIYEWWPSTYLTAHEIVSGEILITDEMSTAPCLRVLVSDQERIYLGDLGSDEYGLRCRDASGNIVFESSNAGQSFAGWTFTDEYFYKLTSGTPESSPNAGIVLSVAAGLGGDLSSIIVYDATPLTRARMGYLYEDGGTEHWGIGSQDGSGNVLFEISDQLIQLAGWTFDHRYFYNLGSGTPGSSPQEGVVLDVGDGSTEFPCVTVYDASGLQRAAMGWLYDDGSDHWGIGGLDAMGNLLFEISDQTTQISGWTITTAALTGGNATLSSTGVVTLGTSNDVVIVSAADATYRLWAGHATAGSAPFRVTKAGALTATSATITGVITATTGYIGGASGWVIAAGKMTSTGIGLATSAGDATYAFWAGDNTPGSAEFRVTHAGALTATSATITGSVTATTGTIGGWTIISGYIYSLVSGTPTSSPNSGIVLESGSQAKLVVWDATPLRRAQVGYLYEDGGTDHWGMGGYDGSGNILFEISDQLTQISGWTITTATLTGGNATLSSTGVVTLGTSNDVVIVSAADATYRLWAGHATAGSAPFRVTKTGALIATNATISGTISATAIDIGGADNTSFHVDTDGNMWLGAATYDIGTNPFAVSKAGLMRAVSGTIGGWTLSGNAMSSGAWASNIIHLVANGVWSYISINDPTYGAKGIQLLYSGGTPKAYIGDGANQYFQFDGSNISWKGTNTQLTAAGAFTATSATITGAITATSGTIGSFTIGTYLYSGSKIAYNDANAGVHLGSDGIGIGNNVFTVSSAGALTATSGTIGGATITSTYLLITAAAGLVVAADGGIKLTGHATTPAFIHMYGTSYTSKLGCNATGEVQGWRPESDNTASLHIGVGPTAFTGFSWMDQHRWSYIYLDGYNLFQARAYMGEYTQTFLMLDQGNDKIELKSHSEQYVFSEVTLEAGQKWSNDHYALMKASPYHASDTGTPETTGSGYLTDTDKGWSNDEWIGYYLQDSAGTTHAITDNTDTRLDWDSAATPASGVYWIRNPAFVQVTVDGDANKIILSTKSLGDPGVIDIEYADRIRLQTSKTPASSTDTGVVGDICWDADYIYVCTATNYWERAAIAHW